MQKVIGKYLVVNADDFGLTPGICDGIVDAFKNGIVRSTSLMANGNAFDYAINLVKENPDLGIGVHITLVGETPCSPSHHIPTLIDSSGKLRNNYFAFGFHYLLGQISLKEIEMECELQISKISHAGIKITHIDSHQHLHMFPGIFKVIVKLAIKYDIKYIRIPNENSLNVKSLILKLLTFINTRTLKLSKLKSSESFFGLKYSGHLSKKNVLKYISNCGSGITELMAHPGHIDQEYLDSYSHWKYAPKQELDVLTDQEIISEVTKGNICLISFA